MDKSISIANDFFYVIDSGSNSNQHMFSDVQKMRNAKQLSNVFVINNPVLRVLNKIHLSIKINKVIDLPLKGIWNSFYIMNEKLPREGITKWVILTNWSIRRFALSYLKKLEQEDHIKTVLLYLDPLSAVPEFYLKYIQQVDFDLIYSFDEEDCKRYGWKHTTSLYSMNDFQENDNPEYDVFYVGLDKGRADLLKRIYYVLVDHGLKCNFMIVTEDGSSSDNGNGLRYLNHRVSYEEILQEISNARVILEVVQGGQSGMTMRPYEAIFYNRKLLTNNRKILDMDFFRSDYMSCFSSEKDIDLNFLKDTSKVDFEYQYQYSPINWLLNMPSDYINKNK